MYFNKLAQAVLCRTVAFLAILSLSGCVGVRNCDSLRVAMDSVAAVRGKEFLAPVSCEKRSLGFFRNHLNMSLRAREERVKREGRIYEILGILPASRMSHRTRLADLYGDRVGGFYDPEQQKLYLLTSEAPHTQQAILIHELTHALQDQHFQLKDFLNDTLSHDRLMTRTAIVEGEANAVSYEIQGALNCQKRGVLQLLRSVARRKFTLPTDESLALRVLMDFPYLVGLAFVCSELGSGKEWRQIDSLLAAPPHSSVQLLKRLWSAEPGGVDLTSLDETSAVGGRLAGLASSNVTDTMGAYFAFALLVERLSVEDAFRIALGWKADQLSYSSSDASSDQTERLTWTTDWQDAALATEFRNALALGIKPRERFYQITQQAAEVVLTYAASGQ